MPIYFLQAAPGVHIFCANANCPEFGVVSASPGRLVLNVQAIERRDGKCVRPNKGKILNAILDLVDEHSWSFPRAKADAPYITQLQATLLESEFKTMVNAPNDGNCIYASVSKAGTLLAERIGIDTELILDVSHYDMATNTQDDARIKVSSQSEISVEGKTVIVIDDLISSGRTARAIVHHLLKAGAAKIYFFALYRTICSKEVEIPEGDNVVIRSYAPLSNAYWTYGRGFDLTDDESRNLDDIYGSTKHWDWETDSDVNELISFFSDSYRVEDYSDVVKE